MFYYLIFSFLLIFLGSFQLTDSIDCFECISYNHDNRECEDPFYRSEKISLKENCLAAIPIHQGFYRATHCLKLNAEGHGFSYFIRTCVVDTGSGKDQNIVQVSHCGLISLENFYGINFTIKFDKFKTLWNVFNGCLSVCQYDECNNGVNHHTWWCLLILMIILTLLTKSI